MSKMFTFDQDTRDKILKGVNVLAKSVGSTLGPAGHTVLIQQQYGPPKCTKDGVSVAKAALPLKDPFENIGAGMLLEAAQKTCNDSGDGTTGATILSAILINEGAKLVSAGHNPMEIKRGIDFAVGKVVEELKNMARPVKNKEEIAQVGTISANGDQESGQMIADAMEQVGNDGLITVEDGKGAKSELKLTNGYMFDRGYLSSYFATNDKLECVLENVLVLLAEKEISNVHTIMPILNHCSKNLNGQPLLIIAENVGGDCLPTLVLNHCKQSFRSVCVKKPGFGDRSKEMLGDIAVLTGAEVVSEDLGRKMENFDPSWLGHAKRVVVTKTTCTIVEGSGDPEAVQTRANEIRNAMAQFADGEHDKKKQQERLAKLVGGVAVLSIGADTDAALKEKKDRVEDALNATKAAVQEGCVAGGGLALLRAATVLDRIDIPQEFKLGAKIVRKAAEEPMKCIADNAGTDATMVRITVMANDNPNFGYNARTEQYQDLMENGVIDPVKVIRTSLINAASVAGLVLTTNCMIADEPEEKKQQNGGMMMQ